MQCAESALKSVIGDLSNTYFVGNAPTGHMVVQPAENAQDLQSCKVWTQTWFIICTNFGAYNSVFMLYVENSVFFSLSQFYEFTSPFLSFHQRFFLKSQVIATNKFKIGKCDDYVWVT